MTCASWPRPFSHPVDQSRATGLPAGSDPRWTNQSEGGSPDPETVDPRLNRTHRAATDYSVSR